jgi:hypothetical protein
VSISVVAVAGVKVTEPCRCTLADLLGVVSSSLFTSLLGVKKKKKNSWLLGKMFESGFPDASGREEG